jgi:uncharacterized protein YecT (DUF1311 family)
MRIKSLVLIAFSLVALHSAALADGCTDCGLTNRSDDQDCALEKTPLTRCETLRAYMKGDRELNNTYRKLTKQLDANSLSVLKTTQRAWIQWRDDKCEDIEEAANCTNGVCAGVNHDNCVVDLTKKRSNELAGFSKKLQSAKESGFVFDKKYRE